MIVELHKIGQKILETLKLNPSILQNAYKINSLLELRRTPNSAEPELHLSCNEVMRNFENNNFATIFDNLRNVFTGSKFITEVKQSPLNFVLKLDKEQFISNVLNGTENQFIVQPPNPNQIIVEFSSPNIAKPFHVGHLRSTIIGNFISNLHSSFGHNVIRLNYLGDWGTQFGFLKIGMDLAQLSDDEIKATPIKHMYNAYVNATRLAESDERIAEQARNVFHKMESGCLGDIDNWNRYKKFTVDELTSIYSRLGIKFDEYCWESQYNRSTLQPLLDDLFARDILIRESDGKVVTIVDGKPVTFLKSDGSTLYLTRDVAAILDRLKRYRFDKMLYVVENGQHDHFKGLFKVTERLQVDGMGELEHIKFGRIHGMSTRKGNVVFLNDILDEAQSIMLLKQIQSKTTKVDLNDINDKTADVLGISAVIVNDLKQRRQRDYDFDWIKALQVNGDTGIKIQYTHCRLCSLEEATGVQMATHCNSSLLLEPEAYDLIFEIAKYHSILHKCIISSEACILVNYLFGLCNSISRALKTLNIKGHPDKEVQEQRMLLFMTAKRTLHHGMQILGLNPLTKM